MRINIRDPAFKGCDERHKEFDGALTSFNNNTLDLLARSSRYVYDLLFQPFVLHLRAQCDFHPCLGLKSFALSHQESEPLCHRLDSDVQFAPMQTQKSPYHRYG